MITIELPWERPPISSNGSRGSHHAHAGKVKAARKQAYICGRAHLIGYGPLPSPCEVRIVWTVTNQIERDTMNLAWTLKPVLDGFVDAGLWKGDHFKVINESKQRIEVGKVQGLRLEITEVEV